MPPQNSGQPLVAPPSVPPFFMQMPPPSTNAVNTQLLPSNIPGGNQNFYNSAYQGHFPPLPFVPPPPPGFLNPFGKQSVLQK